MKIEIIESNLNSATVAHPSLQAWELSRPNNSPIPLDDILKLDLPVNEIPMVTIFIESTILEREIIVSARNHVMWAQTSRVQDILSFEYPNIFELKDQIYFESQRNKMKIQSDEGVRQDEYRKHLPIMSSTKYTINISMRDIISLVRTFMQLSKENDHLAGLFDGASSEFLFLLYEHFNFLPEFLEKYKGKPILRKIHNNVEHGCKAGDTIIVVSKMPLSLRAQLARHRNLTIQDNLLELISDENIITKDIEMEVTVQVSGLSEDWHDVISKRSCWIAQYDLWSDLLNKASAFFENKMDLLPCANGNCPYDGDAQARYTDEDPNAPCPIHAKLNKNSVTTKQIIEMNSQAIADVRPTFWYDEISNFSSGEQND